MTASAVQQEWPKNRASRDKVYVLAAGHDQI